MSSDPGISRLQLPLQQPWFVIFATGPRIVVSSAIGAFVFFTGGVLDWFVTQRYLPRFTLMLGGAVLSIGVGSLLFLILTNIQRRYQMMLDQLRRIAQLNHHIRNALQIIAYHNVPDRSERAIRQVNTQIARIQTALRAVSAALGDADSSPNEPAYDDRRFGS